LAKVFFKSSLQPFKEASLVDKALVVWGSCGYGLDTVQGQGIGNRKVYVPSLANW
jgi:hypothetical protein